MQAGAQASPRINIRKKLRSVVQDNLDKGLFSSAIFFADKLVTLSNGRLTYLQCAKFLHNARWG